MSNSSQAQAEVSNVSAVVERLRGQIRKLEAQPRTLVLALRTGVPELDALGAFRLGGAVELNGEEASGRTTVALSLVAAAAKEQRLSAWVDGPQELYPPAALSLGVQLDRLLIVRPKAPGQLVWSAVQLLRSGAFTCVVLDITHTGVRWSLTDTKKVTDAARAGGSLLVLLTQASAPAQGVARLTLRPQGGTADGRHLRLVQTSGPGFEVSTQHGKQVPVQRARLAKHRQVPLRRAGRLGALPERSSIAPITSLQRPKKNVLRDGYPGMPGHSRPGRDSPLHLKRPSPTPDRRLPNGRSWR